ncbi:MAG: DMT family transporter, partial [Alistipes sp.]
MGLIFSMSSLTLFESFHLMDAGIASTLLFVYPVLVAVIMALFFKERISLITLLAILLALGGIALLYKGENGATLNVTGVAMVFVSALCYAIYIVGVNRSALHAMPTEKLTFYALLFGLSVFFVRLRMGADLQAIPTPSLWVNALALGLLPTVISLVTMAIAIRHIGSTPTAILGALEPVTALFFGVMVFGEPFTSRIAMGV